ncbi:MAG: hypothetical protein ACRDCW_02380 [Sarcina sp.]
MRKVNKFIMNNILIIFVMILMYLNVLPLCVRFAEMREISIYWGGVIAAWPIGLGLAFIYGCR